MLWFHADHCESGPRGPNKIERGQQHREASLGPIERYEEAVELLGGIGHEEAGDSAAARYRVSGIADQQTLERGTALSTQHDEVGTVGLGESSHLHPWQTRNNGQFRRRRV